MATDFKAGDQMRVVLEFTAGGREDGVADRMFIGSYEDIDVYVRPYDPSRSFRVVAVENLSDPESDA